MGDIMEAQGRTKGHRRYRIRLRWTVHGRWSELEGNFTSSAWTIIHFHHLQSDVHASTFAARGNRILPLQFHDLLLR